MPEYRRRFQPGGTYFFTVVTDDRRPLFAQDSARQLLHESIRAVQIRWPFELMAIVLLPQHLHCLWRLPDEDQNYSTRWACIKKQFSHLWLASGGKERQVSSSRRKHRDCGIWQRRFWEHRIRDEEDLIHHVNYIHYNPIKHGLARCPHAWPYSSFHRWVKEGYYKETWLCDCDSPVVVPANLLNMPDGGE